MEMGDRYICIYIYAYIYSTRDLTLMARAYVMWAELSVNHFYKGNHWKRALKMIFKESGCFKFAEAVVTSTLKESLRSTERFTTSSRCFIGVVTVVNNCSKLR